MQLPNLNCGVCGFRTCHQFAKYLEKNPQEIKRCIHLSANKKCAVECKHDFYACEEETFVDVLGREFDFYLEHFYDQSGPEEVISPFNVNLLKEKDIWVGDILIGRPFSAGCPVTHCGKVKEIDVLSGLITWCVVGPMLARSLNCKDIGCYHVHAFKGLVKKSRCDLKIGMRYFFQPRLCMLQWRHSGLINYICKQTEGVEVRIESICIA